MDINTNIFDTGLSRNLCYILNRYSVTTIGKLLSQNKQDLKTWRLIGKARYAEILKFVDDNGFKFDEDIENVKVNSIIEEFLNIGLQDTEFLNDPDIDIEDAFILIVEYLNELDYDISRYINISPVFKKYIKDNSIVEKKDVYKRIDLETLSPKANKPILVNMNNVQVSILTNNIFNISDIIENINYGIFGHLIKSLDINNTIYLKYSVNRYIPLSNGYVYGYDVDNVEIVI